MISPRVGYLGAADGLILGAFSGRFRALVNGRMLAGALDSQPGLTCYIFFYMVTFDSAIFAYQVDRIASLPLFCWESLT